MDYIALLKGVHMFREEWGEDGYYTKLILGRRDVWENLDVITQEHVESVVIEFLRRYRVQFTYKIDREELKETLQKLNKFSKLISHKSLLAGGRKERYHAFEVIRFNRGQWMWGHNAIEVMYKMLDDVYGVGPTSASKILHGINPHLFMMWDRYIRVGYGYNKGECTDYSKFMADCQLILGRVIIHYRRKQALSAYPQDINVAIKELCEKAYPKLEVKKPLTKLLDEYNWMKFRNRKDLPNPLLSPPERPVDKLV